MPNSWQRAHSPPPLRELIDRDLPADELARLTRIDALLRATRPRLRLVKPREEQTQDLRLTHRELALIHRSLQAARTLGVPAAERELLDDTIQLVGQALKAT